jgi:hypothetical protein
VLPGLTSDILSLVNRFLPKSGGIGSDQVLGKASHTPLTSSPLTALSQRAARQNNQLAPEEIKD